MCPHWLTGHWEGVGGLGEVKVKRSEDQREAESRTTAGTSADDLEGKKKRGKRLADRICV